MNTKIVDNWLDSKVGFIFYNKKGIEQLSTKPYYSQDIKSKYYKDNDTDMKANILNDDLEAYNDHIFIHPNTNRYHANMLFRQMVDFSENNKLPIKITPDMKDSFYKYCMNNST